MQTRTKVFFSRVSGHLGRPPLVLGPDASVGEMLDRMHAARAESALVVDGSSDGENGRLIGIVTEQDIARRIALRCSPDEPVSSIMTLNPYFLRADDYLYYAIAMMRRHRLRHIPVIAEDGRPCGVVQLHEALSVAGEAMVGEIDKLCYDRDLAGLKSVKRAQVELATRLMEDKVPAPDVLALISHINADLHLRVLELQIAGLEAEGYGKPPVPFCLIIMGSGGRGENYLYPDQDNGFILDDYPDGEHSRIDPYFIALAERFNEVLDDIGFPFCNGYV
ncbi:MAG: DUF294 nucleotidyltransferase-like domain-containing protein, partial [Kiloniellales bacterium]|nr:DUF294 nucleotidyltransferase-like domain-containing protein [Kiloniellales bacterium]